MSTDLVSLYGPLYGAIYFATIMSTAFYGITCMQTFFYYIHYQSDPLRIKIFVAIMWVLSTAHEALSVSGAYKNIIAGLLDPLSLVSGNPELVLLFLSTTVVSIPTQGFFVYRVYLFSGRNILGPLVFVVLALVQLVCAAVYVAKTIYTGDGLQVSEINALDNHSAQILATICFSVAAGIDIFIAIFMTFLLLRKRTDVGFVSSAHILQRLVVFAVNTGIWTAAFALLSAILLHVYPSNLIYAVFGIPLCPIYCNTLLANLNARAYVRGRAMWDVDVDLGSARPSWQASRGEQRSAASAFQTHGIWKTTEVSTFHDVSQPSVIAGKE